jgi:hypothetical protein
MHPGEPTLSPVVVNQSLDSFSGSVRVGHSFHFSLSDGMDRPILNLMFTVLVPYWAEMDRAGRDRPGTLEWTELKAWQPMVAGRPCFLMERESSERFWSDDCGTVA